MIPLTIALLAFLFPLAWSPGPGNLFFAALGARGGLAASWAASLGYHLATLAVTAAIGFGFATLSHMAPRLLDAIGLAGSAYVLWLAWSFWRASAVASTAPAPRHASLQDGAMLLMLNPKAYIIMAAMFAQFLPDDPTPALVLWITTVFTLHNLVAFTGWTLAGDLLLRRFRRPGTARAFNRGCAILLAVVALWMALGRAA